MVIGGRALGRWKAGLRPRSYGQAVILGVPLAVLAATGWAGFPLIQLPKFAEFLIAVEAEMKQGLLAHEQSELVQSLGGGDRRYLRLAGLLLSVYDWIWQYVLKGR